MPRTQIHLGDDEIALLARVEEQTGASRSELIRRAIRSSYGKSDSIDRIAAVLQTSGTWKGRRITGEGYVDSQRDGERESLDERLERLGL